MKSSKLSEKSVKSHLGQEVQFSKFGCLEITTYTTLKSIPSIVRHVTIKYTCQKLSYLYFLGKWKKKSVIALVFLFSNSRRVLPNYSQLKIFSKPLKTSHSWRENRRPDIGYLYIPAVWTKSRQGAAAGHTPLTLTARPFPFTSPHLTTPAAAALGHNV